MIPSWYNNTDEAFDSKGAGQKKKDGKESKERIELPFEVLGFTPERKILIWHDGYLMPFSSAQLNKDDIGLLMEFTEKITFTLVKSQIIEEARDKGIIEESAIVISNS